jgi:hypothetical protein
MHGSRRAFGDTQIDKTYFRVDFFTIAKGSGKRLLSIIRWIMNYLKVSDHDCSLNFLNFSFIKHWSWWALMKVWLRCHKKRVKFVSWAVCEKENILSRQSKWVSTEVLGVLKRSKRVSTLLTVWSKKSQLSEEFIGLIMTT